MFENVFGGKGKKPEPPPKPVIRESGGTNTLVAAGSPKGPSQEREAIQADVTHGGSPHDAQPAPQAEERIPPTLRPATRALAERTLGPSERWDRTSANMRQAIQSLNGVEEGINVSMPIPDTVRTDAGDVPIWDYIGQCVDAIGTGTISGIEATLNQLMDNPSTARIVSRIVALHAAQVVLGCQIMQLAAGSPMQYNRLAIQYFESNYPTEATKLKAIGKFITEHPQSKNMTTQFLNFNVPLLGNQNPLEDVLKHYGLM